MQCVVAMLTKQEELKDRIEVRKHELLKKFAELKADTRHEAIEARAKVKEKLDELEVELRGGWEKLSDAAYAKLDVATTAAVAKSMLRIVIIVLLLWDFFFNPRPVHRLCWSAAAVPAVSLHTQ